MFELLARAPVTIALVACACQTCPPKVAPAAQGQSVAPQAQSAPLPVVPAGQAVPAAQAAVPAAQAADSKVAAATTAALSWLALVDDEKYDQSWSAAATIFKSAVTQATWQSSVSSVRGSLGKLVSRQLKSAEFKTTLPGAPDGEYVVLRFSATFEKKAAAVETVTPTREADGAWKVSGYFIR